jgi:ABC-type lipoprotein release transport system permease subunit
VIGGRWAWVAVAEALGIPPEPTTPVLAVLLVVPAALLVANLLAWVPARRAARTPAAEVLRSE